MLKSFSLIVICLLLFCGHAFAGWYHVENYAGTIGPYPIHFSIQTYDSFGSGITAEGSYYYDMKSSPLPFYGRAANGKFTLCERADAGNFDEIMGPGVKTPVDTKGCSFVLTAKDNAITGTWSRGAKQYPVTLTQTALLDDTGDGKIDGAVVIPFWAQSADAMFQGVYGISGTAICMQKLQIVDKKNHKIDQEILFDKDDCNAGMLMTPIYSNVETGKTKPGNILTVHFRDSRMGYEKEYILNAATGRYLPKE